MSFIGTTFSMVRGDTEDITLSLVDKSGDPILLTVGDTAFLTVKNNGYAAEKLIQKTVTNFNQGKAVFMISPPDTKNLDFGVYKYDIEVHFASGTVKTVVKSSNFYITEEITDE